MTDRASEPGKRRVRMWAAWHEKSAAPVVVAHSTSEVIDYCRTRFQGQDGWHLAEQIGWCVVPVTVTIEEERNA